MAAGAKIALVTGANRGIGFEVCRQLAREGLAVVLTGRDEERGRQAAKSLADKGLDVHYRALDVTSPESIARLRDSIIADYGRLDVLVNNAGIMIDKEDKQEGQEKAFPSVLDSKLETFRRTMETNLYAPLLLCQAFIPLMQQNNYGRIVNVSSGMGQLKFMAGGWPSYRVSKAALNALTRIIADEVKGNNILVNAVCPGWVKTGMGGPSATRSAEEGAETIVWLSMIGDKGPTGSLFRDRVPVEW